MRRPETPLAPEERDLVERNMALVFHVAHRPRHKGIVARLGMDEVAQHGFLALCKAARSFDPRHGTAFSTHACNCINWQIVGLACQSRDDPHRQMEPIHSDSDDQEDPWAVLADSTCPVERRDAGEEALAHVRRLPPTQRVIVETVFGLRGKPPVTANELSRRLGCSRSAVNQHVRKALALLRYAMGLAWEPTYEMSRPRRPDQTPRPPKPCRHCGNVRSTRGRGLCWACEHNDAVRASYPLIGGPSAARPCRVEAVA